MAHLFMIKNFNAFVAAPLFRKFFPGRIIGPSACVVLPSMSGLDGLIADGIIEPVFLPPYTDEDRAAFIRDYIELIASLNRRYQNRFLWWATNISSKSRSTNPLSDLVQELWEIRLSLVAHSDKGMLIIGPSLAIELSLSLLLKQLERKVYWRLSLWRAWSERTAGMIRKTGGIFYNAIKIYRRMLAAKFRLRKVARRLLARKTPFYVIKTFSYDTSWDKEGRFCDVLFGRLAELVPPGRDVLTVTMHHGDIRRLIERIVKNSEGMVLPIEYFLTAKDILVAVINRLFSCIPIKETIIFRGVDVTDIVRHEFSRTFYGISLIQYLHYHMTRNLLQKIQVQTFLISYENNPWERMCTLAIRKYGNGAAIIGYEHAVVSEAALNMFISPKENGLVPLPDRVIVPGQIPLNLMKRHGDYSTVDLVSGCALRYEKLFDAEIISWKRGRQILVALDSVAQTRGLVEFILREAEKLPGYRFTLRPHPELPWRFLAEDYKSHLTRMSHVTVSRGSLKEDLARADVVIYWQSTVGLEALNMGKPLIHFSPDMILSYDPLYSFSSLKWTVRSKDALEKTLDEIYALSDEEFNAQREHAKKFIAEYFYPINPERLQVFWDS